MNEGLSFFRALQNSDDDIYCDDFPFITPCISDLENEILTKNLFGSCRILRARARMISDPVFIVVFGISSRKTLSQILRPSSNIIDYQNAGIKPSLPSSLRKIDQRISLNFIPLVCVISIIKSYPKSWPRD